MAMAEADSVVAELEGTLLKDQDPFPYFMLLALEASGLVRFALLLLLYPLLLLFRAAGRGDLALRLMVFAAAAGAREAEIAAAARAVLPRFYMDDVDAEAWRVYASCGKRVVVTALPRVMVEWFAREHLGAGVVVGAELVITRHGRATGLLMRQEDSVADRVQTLFEAGHRPGVGLGRPNPAPSFLSLCKEQRHPPFTACSSLHSNQPTPPPPVIFHDGRLVRRPTPATALLTLLWMPFGVLLALVRMAVGVVVLVPVWNMPYLIPVFGGKLVVRGRPPPPATTGVLFVCTHRTLMDPLAITVALGRRVTAVTYSISRLSELLSPIRTVRLSRTREVDAGRIAAELARGDLVLCPEGTTCREPFLLRFSMLFAELTDRIVPVAIDYKVGFFHPTTATGWKAMDPLFFFMNPRPAYEVTFLSQLPEEATCSAGRSPLDVANYVQRVLAAALGFECTNYTRRDKYRILAGNDGSLSS